MITDVGDYLPQATAPVVILLGLITAALLISVLAALHSDSLDMAEAADLRRLTAQLPPGPGRHRLDRAPGTPAQQRHWRTDTVSFSAAELWEALRVEEVAA